MSESLVRVASSSDAAVVGGLLDEFHLEFDEETPGADVLAGRAATLMDAGSAVFLLADDPAVGLLQLRFRDSVWTGQPDAYLEDLYVVPAARGRGLGADLLDTAIELARSRDAAYMEIAVTESDITARVLYERRGFKNYEVDGHDRITNYFYLLHL